LIELTPSLLARSPAETVRHLCLGLLEQADSALGRLERGEDEEALHDFRVALRRLRSVVRAYRPYLKGSARKKLRARLRALAASTNAARDLEVQMEWLSKRAPELEPEAGSGAIHLAERLRSRGDETPRPQTLRKEFDPLHRSLRKSLSRVRLRLGDEATDLSATGDLVAESASRLKTTLEAISSAEDGDGLHRARIEAKRLRYLLEPISAEVSEARGLVKEMKTLQDVLGELQDMRVLSQSIAAELERAAVEEAHRLRDLALQEGAIEAQGAPAHPGLLALLRAQRERRDRQYLALSRSWLSGASDPFFERAQRLARSLAALSEPEKPPRRFLLSEVPERAKRRAPAIVRQAFLPGRKIHEIVESIQSGERIRCSRIAVSEGSRAEERVTGETFERFWSLASFRLERARYRVRENGRTYWIDEARDGRVVLAETEDAPDLVLPEWLESVVRREVTGSRKYDWESLARESADSTKRGRGQRASSLGS
jgi:CHAD domain-containing protein/CYTH domain-containing protein